MPFNRLIASALLFAFAFAVGCAHGSQRGQYTVRGSSSESLANNAGIVLKMIGTPSSRQTGPPQLLVAVVFVGPGFATTGSSHKTFVSREDITSAAGDFPILWNRSTDTLRIMQSEYERAEGNLFVVRLTDTNNLTSQQIPIPVTSRRTEAILEAVQATLPDDDEVQDLTIIP